MIVGQYVSMDCIPINLEMAIATERRSEEKIVNKERASSLLLASASTSVGSSNNVLFHSIKCRESMFSSQMGEMVAAQKDGNIFTKHVLMKINNKSFTSLCDVCAVSNVCTLHTHSKIFYGFSHTPRMSISWITKELFLPV